jgi:hypothetical protein
MEYHFSFIQRVNAIPLMLIYWASYPGITFTEALIFALNDQTSKSNPSEVKL